MLRRGMIESSVDVVGRRGSFARSPGRSCCRNAVSVPNDDRRRGTANHPTASPAADSARTCIINTSSDRAPTPRQHSVSGLGASSTSVLAPPSPVPRCHRRRARRRNVKASTRPFKRRALHTGKNKSSKRGREQVSEGALYCRRERAPPSRRAARAREELLAPLGKVAVAHPLTPARVVKTQQTRR